MSRYRVQNQNHLYFITFRVVGWIDVFSRKRYKDILIESFKYCQEHKEPILNVKKTIGLLS